MARKFDADLCRAKGWTPGDILGFSPAAEDYRGSPTESPEVLTAIGLRSILTVPLIYKTVPNPEEPGCWKYAEPPQFVLDARESQSAGTLYRKVIRKIGRWDFEKNVPAWDEEPANVV